MRHEESTIQCACVKAFRLIYPRFARLLIAIPNGGARSLRTGVVLKAEGVMAGAPDLFLFVPSNGYHGLAIEMKTAKGRQQESQKEWQQAAEMQGYKYIICRSYDDFQKGVSEYLDNQSTT